MKPSLVFATGNRHKLREVQGFFQESFALLGLTDLGITEEIPEEADTLQGNALQKARYVYARCQRPCFADDTGLEVEALGGAPGVYSARYAGESHDAAANMRLLLHNMQGKTQRHARFRTVLAYIDAHGREHCFEGVVEGEILVAPQGTAGFGYDPIFRPMGYAESFAELSLEEKNRISHRVKAVSAFLHYLKTV